ncbi:hypothetical protein H4582DRAFT_2063378 [Lactarius indigo]|nr:hypothetical protein H4582DRAFT_2063378 [Lactarius indigo]
MWADSIRSHKTCDFNSHVSTLSSSLTSWKEVGNVTTALKLVAATIKTCWEARLMCKNARTTKMGAFISDVYLEKTLKCLESCWVSTGGVLTSQKCIPPIPTTPSYHNIAMSPPPCGPSSPPQVPMIKIKRPTPVTSVAADNVPGVPPGTNPTNHNVAMSSPPHVPMIKIKQPIPVTSVTAGNTPGVLPGTNSTNQQPTTSTEHTGPSAGLDKGTHADTASLKLLQVSELLALFSDNNLSAPKGKCKDDLITAIVESPELSQVLKLTIMEIIGRRKKAPKKQVALLL